MKTTETDKIQNHSNEPIAKESGLPRIFYIAVEFLDTKNSHKISEISAYIKESTIGMFGISEKVLTRKQLYIPKYANGNKINEKSLYTS